MATRRFSRTLKLAILLLVFCTILLLNRTWHDDMPSVYRTYLNGNGEGGRLGDSGDSRHQLVEVVDGFTDEDVISHGAEAWSKIRKRHLSQFYDKVFKYMKDFEPAGLCSYTYSEDCLLEKDIVGRPGVDEEWFKLTSKELGRCLQISKSHKAGLKELHQGFVKSIGELTFHRGLYRGDGIVTVGGGKFSVLALLMISTLRKVGTKLPVEVLIPPREEGDNQFCGELLPKLNAKCIYLSNVLSDRMLSTFMIEGYQLKSMAIIASSFDNLLLLDADNIPIVPLDDIFKSNPYTTTGMILWPDYWRRTTSPAYYEIVDAPVNMKKRVRNCMDNVTPAAVYTKDSDLPNIPLHDFQGTMPDVSTESGQLMIKKTQHISTILLSLYYNINGPKCYYPLFSQKAAGEGDKETFIASAHYYDLPYYQVKTITGTNGYHFDGGFEGVAMLQHDFREDYERYSKSKDDVYNKYGTGSSATFDPEYTLTNYYQKYFESGSEARVMFVHSNYPKFEPLERMRHKDFIRDGKHFRSINSVQKLNGYDLELESYIILNDYLCERKVEFKYYEEELADEAERISMCKYVKDRLEYLKSSHEEAIKQ